MFWFAISNISIPFGIRAGKYRYRLIYQYMEKVPIRPIDLSNRTDKSRHDRMVKLVETIQALHQQLSKARTADDKTLIQRQIDATDRQIDRLVYELYGLTEAEIAIVEGAEGETDIQARSRRGTKSASAVEMLRASDQLSADRYDRSSHPRFLLISPSQQV